MNKQPQITEQTRKNIIKAFWSIYKKKDISKITVTETIKKAGYNRATFYNYFDGIQSILDYVENEIIKNVEETIKKLTENGISVSFGTSWEQSSGNIEKQLSTADHLMYENKLLHYKELDNKNENG